jgi:hypothetical protein
MKNYLITYSCAMFLLASCGLVVLAALFIFLQEYSKFHFFFIEQSQLFQFTGEYISEKLAMPGGFALTLSEFLVQFFIYPYAGAGITAGLLLLTGLGMRGIVRRIAPDTNCFLLYLIPIVLIMFLHFDFIPEMISGCTGINHRLCAIPCVSAIMKHYGKVIILYLLYYFFHK